MDIPLSVFSGLYGLLIVVAFTFAICLGLIRQDNLECHWIIYTINLVCAVSLAVILLYLCID